MEKNIHRNPMKKRGRPKEPITKRDFTRGLGSRNKQDMLWDIEGRIIDEDFRRELLAMCDNKQTTLTVVACVARFKPEDQRRAFEVLNKLGARGAKRFVESLRDPPSRDVIAGRLVRWLKREFPLATDEDLALACYGVWFRFEESAKLEVDAPPRQRRQRGL
jgi:hypothetical protein